MLYGLSLGLLLEVRNLSLIVDRLGVGCKMRDLLRDRRVSYGIVRFYRKYLIVSLLSARTETSRNRNQQNRYQGRGEQGRVEKRRGGREEGTY